jgi:hypothetical protein
VAVTLKSRSKSYIVEIVQDIAHMHLRFKFGVLVLNIVRDRALSRKHTRKWPWPWKVDQGHPLSNLSKILSIWHLRFEFGVPVSNIVWVRVLSRKHTIKWLWPWKVGQGCPLWNSSKILPICIYSSNLVSRCQILFELERYQESTRESGCDLEK